VHPYNFELEIILLLHMPDAGAGQILVVSGVNYVHGDSLERITFRLIDVSISTLTL